MKSVAIVLAFCAATCIAQAQKPELMTIQEGHNNEVLQVSFSPDERQILSTDAERIILWDLNSGKYVRHIEPEAIPVLLCFSGDATIAIAVLDDNSLNAWSLASGEKKWRTQLSDSAIVAAQASPDLQSLVVCSSDRFVRCWDLSTGIKRWEKQLPNDAAAIICFSASGDALAVRDSAGLLIASYAIGSGENKSVFPETIAKENDTFFVLNSNKCISLSQDNLTLYDFQEDKTRSLPKLATWLQARSAPNKKSLLVGVDTSASRKIMHLSDFAFSKTSEVVVLAMGINTAIVGRSPGLPYSRFGHGEILIWDTQKDELLQKTIEVPEIINDLAVSAASNCFLSGSSDYTVSLWNIKNGKEIKSLRRVQPMEHGFNFSADFKQVAITRFDASFKTWDLERRNELFYRPPTLESSSLYPARDFDAVVLSKDGKQLVTSSRTGAVNLWRTKGLEHLGKLEDRHLCLEVATALNISTDGKSALIGSSSEWRAMSSTRDLIPTKRIKSFITNSSKDTIGFVRDSKRIYGSVRAMPNGFIAFAPSPANVSLWDMEQKQSKQVFYTDANYIPQAVSSVQFSPDYRFALATVIDKMMAWDINTGVRIANEKGVDFFHTSSEQLPDQLVATISTDSLYVSLWSLNSGKIARTFKSNSRILAVCLNPAGKQLCAFEENGYLTEWDAQTGEILNKVPSSCDKQWAAYAPDANFVVLRGEGAVTIVHVPTGKANHYPNEQHESSGLGIYSEHFFENHIGEQISSFQFLPDGKKAISTTYAGTIQCWDYTSGALLFTLNFPGEKDWVVTTPAGLFDASPGAMQALYYRVGTEVIEIEQLKERYFEPGLLQTLMGFSAGELRSVEGFGSVELYPIVRARIVFDTLSISLTERNGGLGKLSLFVNDKEVAENINPGCLKELKIGLKAYSNFYLSDTSNIITLRAYNAKGWLKSGAYSLEHQTVRAKGKDTSTTDNNPAPLRKANPSLYALVIGTSNYSGEKLDLNFADKDAADMAKALQSAGGALFTPERVFIQLLSTAADSIKGFSSRQSSKTNIQAAFEELKNKTKPGDILIVYFSGHGLTYAPPAEKAKFYYLTKDIASDDLNDPALRENFTISSDELTQWLTAIPALKQVMILDACNSGKVVEAFEKMAARELSPSQVRAFDRMKDRTGTFILTGSAADKVSFESNRFGQGLLTYSLLEGMSGFALTEDKRMDVMTLFQYSRDKVPDLAKEENGIQTPMLSFPTKGGSFDIGLSTDQVKIPLARMKPVFIRNNFQEENEYEDVLGLTDAMTLYFQGLTAKRTEAPILYVDVNHYEKAYSIKGRYKIKGDVVEVRGRLLQDKTSLGDFKKTGRKADLNALVEDIVNTVFELIK